jgi:hypothetical protein
MYFVQKSVAQRQASGLTASSQLAAAARAERASFWRHTLAVEARQDLSRFAAREENETLKTELEKQAVMASRRR